ncbi:pentapeptide repeat-containing protein [Streptomyces sp. T-3]|nr:pentapeptide repeat-containing protein [Streptomyces sp. T-3]
MGTPPASAPDPPSWPHCGHGIDPATDPVGCPGVHAPGHTTCLAHLNDSDRDAYLTGLNPGADMDHRGTPFTAPLLHLLLDALRDPATGRLHLGAAKFDGAQFADAAEFFGAEFAGPAGFTGAEFSGAAEFDETQFSHEARFDGARFAGPARFDEAQFSGRALFDGVKFGRDAQFFKARFAGDASFARAHFVRDAGFHQAQFSGRTGFEAAQFRAHAGFNEAQFSGRARFREAHFSDSARFNGTRFAGPARFTEVQFAGDVEFERAQFTHEAGFNRARFVRDARFDKVQFAGEAEFERAQFSGPAWFGNVQFSGPAWFGGARFAAHAWFPRARFATTSAFGPMVCTGEVDLSSAVFEVPVTLEIAAGRVLCERTRWESTATLRLRNATVDLGSAVLSFPVAVTAHPAPFTDQAGIPMVGSPAGVADGVRVASVRGVDAAHLMLTDVDLSGCLFAGAFHLDQLRLEGRCTFAGTPAGLHRHRLWPYRWSRRRTLAEEHHWRAQTAGQPAPPEGQAASPRTWRTGPDHPDADLTPDPQDVAALYRQLRKAFEDGKNEPGAADFYYGEMEMRRHDTTGTPRGERVLLWWYWLLSGYGLRASRALGWLAAAVAATIVLMMGLGLPDSSPQQTATGTVPAGGGTVTLTMDKQAPRLTLPPGDRFTTARFDQAVQVVLNSVVFRSSGQDLTTWGTYTEMASRFTEPVLLALAALAMRSRIKR